MAVPVIESSTTATGANVASLTLTKPTGLAVGNLMVAIVALTDQFNNSSDWAATTGWTLSTFSTPNDPSLLTRTAVYTKVADASDVAAASFAFAVAPNAFTASGCLVRISGQSSSPVVASESDASGTATSAPSFVTALSATNPNSIVFMSFAGRDLNVTTSSVSGYASTPSLTWTELADIPRVSGADGIIHGIAYATYDGTLITNRSAIFSESAEDPASSIIAIGGTVDVSGTSPFFSNTPTFFATSEASGVTANNALTVVSPTFFDPIAKTKQPQVWTNETKPTTTWINQDKP